MWVPRSEREVLAAVNAGDLAESATFDAKASLPSRGRSKDLAVDVAAMTADGGTLIYGIAEDDHGRPSVASPIELAGAAERVSQIVQSSISEPPTIEVREVPTEEDPARGYLVVVVPASPQAPHMVTVGSDNRYYGRNATGNVRLTEGDVSLQSHVNPESTTVNTARRTAPYLFDKEGTGGRWLLTEAGREYVEEELSAQLAALGGDRSAGPASDRFVEWATFHQSYAYEDFVEGLRPVPAEDDPGGISYKVVPGVFRRICARAAADPENKYVLVIDEINRGNIAKILGELMTLLEDDKRSKGPNELAVTLPYSGHAFSVPGNLYVIGTMNTADRSVALLDVALRRRFAFVEMMPDASLLDGATVEHEGLVLRLGDLLHVLNRGIARGIDRDHQVGHSYLLGVARSDPDDRVAALEFVWNNQIVPLLEEYFYANSEQLAQLLAPFRADDESDAEADAVDGVGPELGRETGDELMRALTALVEARPEP